MKNFSLSVLFSIASLSAFAGDSLRTAIESAETATKVLKSITKESEIPKAMIRGANCIAAVTITKGGFAGFGVKSGKGLATCRTNDGWSNPSIINVNGLSVGPQIGIGKVSMVMVFVGDKAVEQLKNKNMMGDAQVSLVAGPVGREAMAGVDFKMENGVYSYAKAKGFYLGATLGAAMISPDKTSNYTLYQKTEDYELSKILETSGGTNLPIEFEEFLIAVDDLT